MTSVDRTEAAYWLTLTFKLEGERRRDRNGLVLTANRRLGLGLLDLVQLNPASLPEPLHRFRPTLERLQAAEAYVSGMAFLVDELAERGVDLIPITHGSYPAHLARTLKPDSAPTLLSVIGNVRLLERAGACISGSRKAGPEGLAFARASGSSFARAGITVVTGLAAGPDREGLAGCLREGGRAIGVAPEGILVCRATHDPAVRDGHLTIISEFHPKQQWQAGLAMARNRTLAGLSRALMVADCVAEGGTTNQVKVHRASGLPVFVRRGSGEGAFVATLASEPGVTQLPWDGGVVTLPTSVLSGGSLQEGTTTAPSDVNLEAAKPEINLDARDLDRGETGLVERIIGERKRELAALDRAIAERRAELAELDTVVQARRADCAEWANAPAAPSTEGLNLMMMVREPMGPSYGAREPTTRPESQGTVLNVLRGAAGPMAVGELASATSLSEIKVRATLKALSDTKEVEKVKKGRTTCYTVPRVLRLFPMRT